MSELQSGKELLAVNQICVSHSLNNSGLWGLGNFPYGSILRTTHVYEARSFKGVGEYISKTVVLDVLDDTYISGERLRRITLTLLSSNTGNPSKNVGHL